MSRVSLGNGKWFDPETCEHWEEATRWNGQNHISQATGSQWNHEELYRTKKGSWILHCWSQWQGSTPSYEIIDEERAQRWLIDQWHEAPAEAEV